MRVQLVADFMTAPVTSVHLGASLKLAEERILKSSVSALAVVDPEERLCGVLSMSDLLRSGRLHSADEERAALRLPHQRVEQLMRRDVVSVASIDALATAARRMVEHHVHRVFVVDEDKLVGVVSTKDVGRALAIRRLKTPIGEYLSRELISIDVTFKLGAAIDRLTDAGVGGLVVLDGEWPVGLFTQAEALAARALPAASPVEEAMSFALICLPDSTPLWRAAGHLSASRARRVLGIGVDHKVSGIVSGTDLAAAYVAHYG